MGMGEEEPKLFYINPPEDEDTLDWLRREGFDFLKDDNLEFSAAVLDEDFYNFYCLGLNVHDLIRCFREDFNDLNAFIVPDLTIRTEFTEVVSRMKTSKPINKMERELYLLKEDSESEFGMYVSPYEFTLEDTQIMREIEEKNEEITPLVRKKRISHYIWTHDNYFTSLCTPDRNQILQCIDYAVRGNLYNILRTVLPELPSEMREQLFCEAQRKGIVSHATGYTSKLVWDDLQKNDKGFTLRLNLGKTWDGKKSYSKREFEKAYLTYSEDGWHFYLGSKNLTRKS
jgi:hypothetical protein